MATRTVRLDDEAEEILAQLMHKTGLSISELIKKGLFALRECLETPSDRSAWDLYEKLDLGPGGYSINPSTESRRGIQEALRRKLGR